MLTIQNLSVAVGDTQILNAISLSVQKGETHVIMGPNGSGKSTLANALMGHPKYTVTKGNINIDDEEITYAKPDVRAKKGLFLSMQNTPDIPGVSISSFLRLAVEAKTGEKQHPVKFYKQLEEKMRDLTIDPAFAKRELNVGFSGGEKKRIEILQLLLLNPTYAILDETDSGLDVDALKMVGQGIQKLSGTDKGILLITHYPRLLEYITPTYVHIMMQGEIVKTGGGELAKEIEKSGFGNI